MSQVLGSIISLLVTLVAIRFLLRKYQTQFVLFTAGIVLMLAAILLGAKPSALLPSKVASSGFIFFDIFKMIEHTMSVRVAGLGLIIMAAGGFAKYMDVIGASRVMVNLVTSPLLRLKAPYLMLALAYLVGAWLKMFINSSAGLAMLLMVTIFPVVVRLGVSRIAAAAMVVSTGGMTLGFGGVTSFAAKNSGLEITDYFLNYQTPVGITTGIALAVLHLVVQRYMDKRDGVGAAGGETPQEETVSGAEAKNAAPEAPLFYALLPAVPLILLLLFSNIGIKGIRVGVVSAMFMGLAVGLVCECFRKGKEAKAAFKEGMSFFEAMGRQFASVVSLVVAGETFAQGLMATGCIDLLISSAQSAGFGMAAMVVATSAFVLLATIVMGSGNAPFFAFGALAPTIAKDMSFEPVAMLLAMQFAQSVGRIMSPITAVTLAVAGVANVSPFALVRRTMIPGIGAIIVAVVTTLVLAP